ncbi:hypothetical protein ACFXTN_042324 [Malus domestica]
MGSKETRNQIQFLLQPILPKQDAKNSVTGLMDY